MFNNEHPISQDSVIVGPLYGPVYEHMASLCLSYGGRTDVETTVQEICDSKF
jgi:hypothetical protein